MSQRIGASCWAPDRELVPARSHQASAVAAASKAPDPEAADASFTPLRSIRQHVDERVDPSNAGEPFLARAARWRRHLARRRRARPALCPLCGPNRGRGQLVDRITAQRVDVGATSFGRAAGSAGSRPSRLSSVVCHTCPSRAMARRRASALRRAPRPRPPCPVSGPRGAAREFESPMPNRVAATGTSSSSSAQLLVELESVRSRGREIRRSPRRRRRTTPARRPAPRARPCHLALLPLISSTRSAGPPVSAEPSSGARSASANRTPEVSRRREVGSARSRV